MWGQPRRCLEEGGRAERLHARPHGGLLWRPRALPLASALLRAACPFPGLSAPVLSLQAVALPSSSLARSLSLGILLSPHLAFWSPRVTRPPHADALEPLLQFASLRFDPQTCPGPVEVTHPIYFPSCFLFSSGVPFALAPTLNLHGPIILASL